jgi:hypothetical protein
MSTSNWNTKPRSQAVSELTEALERVLRELEVEAPQTISVFFDGTEVYRQQAAEDSVFWWGEDYTVQSTAALVSSPL